MNKKQRYYSPWILTLLYEAAIIYQAFGRPSQHTLAEWANTTMPAHIGLCLFVGMALGVSKTLEEGYNVFLTDHIFLGLSPLPFTLITLGFTAWQTTSWIRATLSTVGAFTLCCIAGMIGMAVGNTFRIPEACDRIHDDI